MSDPLLISYSFNVLSHFQVNTLLSNTTKMLNATNGKSRTSKSSNFTGLPDLQIDLVARFQKGDPNDPVPSLTYIMQEYSEL